MQINLFKNDKVNRQYNRMGSQIFTRKYAVKHSEDLERFKTIKSENPRFLQGGCISSIDRGEINDWCI